MKLYMGAVIGMINSIYKCNGFEYEYRKPIYLYGVSAYKSAMKFFEDKQEYEKCSLMKKAIEYHNTLCNDKLTTII